MIPPRQARNLACRQNSQLPLQLSQCLPGKILTHANQANTTVGIMFGLTQKVASHQSRIRVVVRDHKNLCGPGQQIDATAAEQLPLGLCNKTVTSAAKDIHRLISIEAESHQRKSRYAAQHIKGVSSGLMN